MRKILTFLMIASIFSLVACGPTEEEKVAAEAEAADAVEQLFDELEEEEADSSTEDVSEATEHVCNDKCTTKVCNFVCGEKGHVCSDACHAD
ncbi:MAG: hypothetical protein A3K10_12420 [Bacteroidetes bacterium RIFCSPLOWO2_12_FULL_31_6]|nr:MAG: hypothetical protein A3K10_12420 [Bacteroidetes bacterium RIFCSPLOWO2_12_FULL_31_6]